MEKIRTIWRERADRLENYVLAQGIYGSRWFDDSRWKVKRYRGLELHSDVQTDEELAMQEDLHIFAIKSESHFRISKNN